MTEPQAGRSRICLALFVIIFAIGIFLRLPPTAFSGPNSPLHSWESIHPTSPQQGVGFDEGMYRGYLITVIDGGLGSYPQIAEHYIELQGRVDRSVLPPSRFLYIFSGYLWYEIFGSEPLNALKDVAAFFNILALFAATGFAWRLKGPIWALGVSALMAVAPTQVHMSQHAMIDGFFSFWALLSLWLLWENLQSPGNWYLLAGYICVLSLLVLIKENSFFVWIALVAVLAANRWLKFGSVTPALLLATVAGPLLGVVILTFLAGGIGNLITSYQLLVTKAPQFAYAILTGDGPWHRYLIDLLLVSPIILILAIGSLFRLRLTMKPELYFVVFIAASYLIMCNVRYGMNLRYANMWDMPLRFLALSCVSSLIEPFTRYRNLMFGVAIALIAAIEFHQYIVLAVRYPLYELITHDLLRALHILKTP